MPEIETAKINHVLSIAGELHEAYNKQCCGDEVVASDMACCGRGTEGMSYNTDVDRTCCGSEYVDRDRSICCTDSSNKQKVSVLHIIPTVNLMKLIKLKGRKPHAKLT